MNQPLSCSASAEEPSLVSLIPFSHINVYVSEDDNYPGRLVLRACKSVGRHVPLALVGGVESIVPPSSPYSVALQSSTSSLLTYIDACVFANCYNKSARASFSPTASNAIKTHIAKHCPLALFAVPSTPTLPPNSVFKNEEGIITLCVKERRIRFHSKKKGMHQIRVNIVKDEIIVADYTSIQTILLTTTSSSSSFSSTLQGDNNSSSNSENNNKNSNGEEEAEANNNCTCQEQNENTSSNTMDEYTSSNKYNTNNNPSSPPLPTNNDKNEQSSSISSYALNLLASVSIDSFDCIDRVKTSEPSYTHSFIQTLTIRTHTHMLTHTHTHTHISYTHIHTHKHIFKLSHTHIHIYIRILILM